MRNTIQVTVLGLIFTSLASAFNLMCYVDKESRLRNGPAQFDASKIDVNLCTHLVAAYADIQNNVVTATSAEMEFFNTLTALKASNPDLKVLLGVGGAESVGYSFSDMAATAVNRVIFIQSAINTLRANDFDGILLDWRYPDTTNDKDEFTALCQEMASAFDSEPTGGDERLLLTAAVSGHKDHMDASYDIPQLDTYLDLIHVLAHDFYDVNTGVTRHHAPLFRGMLDYGTFWSWNVEFSMMYWKNKGASAEKVLMGTTTYGRTFTLRSRHFTSIGSKIHGPGAAGPYTQRPGYLSRYEVCSSGLTRSWNEDQQVPYGYSGTLWVGYDDQESIAQKATFVINYGFGGAAVWSLDQDDFNGDVCDEGPYPLVSQMFDYLEAGIPSINFTTAAETGSFCPTEGAENSCIGRENGQYSVPGYPSCFYNCWGHQTHLQHCQAEQIFNEECSCCDYDDSSSSEEEVVEEEEDDSSDEPDEDFCIDKSPGYYAHGRGNPRIFYQCHNRQTFVKWCQHPLVFDVTCTCCNWP